MKNLESVNISKLSDTYELKYKIFMPSLYNNWVDVYYKGQRIAIINGMVSPLQWTAENGSNIPVRLVNKIEKYCSKNIITA